MVTEMKTIKIPELEFERVREARQLLAMNGLNSLNPQMQKVIQNEIKDFEKLTMGIIIGIGATLLIQALTKS
jgi:hypothetical protein